ncbi:MAG: hypothetical protein ABEJ92_11830 [Halobacteriales archaeon]
MARAPPTDDSEPELVEFGIPVLDDRLEAAEVEFPADRASLEAELGDLEIPYDAHGRTVTLATALERAEQDAFESKHDLLDALHPVFEGYRQRASTGLVATLRAMLPF